MKIVYKIAKGISDFFYTYCSAIPLLFAVTLFIHPIMMYIPELNFDLTQPFSPFVFILICVVWRFCTPYHKCFKPGTTLAAAFYLAPIEIFFLMIFAQHSFGFAAAFIAVIAALSISFRMWLRSDERKTHADQKTRNENTVIGHRFFLVVFSVIMIIPSFFAVFIFRLSPPQYTAVTDEGHAIYDGIKKPLDRTKPELTDELKTFLGSKIDDYTAEERLNMLQKLADYETACLGSSDVKVVSERMDDVTYGSYKPGDDYLIIDYKHITTSRTAEIVRTLLHEVYHSYQFYVITKADWTSELAFSQYFDKAAEWANNLLRYKSGYSDFDAYSTQPLEADAAEYARTEWARLQKEAGLAE